MNTINSVNATDDVAYQRVVRDVDLLRAKNCELQLRLELVQAKLDAVAGLAFEMENADAVMGQAYWLKQLRAALGCDTTRVGGDAVTDQFVAECGEEYFYVKGMSWDQKSMRAAIEYALTGKADGGDAFRKLYEPDEYEDAFKGRDLKEAMDLAEGIWRIHYTEDAPNFQPATTISGCLSQISNMVTGLDRNHRIPARVGSKATQPVESVAQGGEGFRGLDLTGRPIYGRQAVFVTTTTDSTAPARRGDV